MQELGLKETEMNSYNGNDRKKTPKSDMVIGLPEFPLGKIYFTDHDSRDLQDGKLSLDC